MFASSCIVTRSEAASHRGHATICETGEAELQSQVFEAPRWPIRLAVGVLIGTCLTNAARRGCCAGAAAAPTVEDAAVLVPILTIVLETIIIIGPGRRNVGVPAVERIHGCRELVARGSC